MKLSQKFTPTNNEPEPGGYAGIWLSVTPQEVADAIVTGPGPGVPDANGTPVAGTIVPGKILELNATGNVNPATQAVIGTNFSKLYMVAFTGNDDYSGAYVGDVIACHGGIRFDTECYDTGVTYNPGHPLVISNATAGNVMPKATVSDGVQALGHIGPEGEHDGVLDCIAEQGVNL